jgi:hypothetical protein
METYPEVLLSRQARPVLEYVIAKSVCAKSEVIKFYV